MSQIQSQLQYTNSLIYFICASKLPNSNMMRKTFNTVNCHQITIKQALLCDFNLPRNQTIIMKSMNEGRHKKSLSSYTSKSKDNYQIETTADKIRPTHFLSSLRNKKCQKYSPDKVSLSKKKSTMKRSCTSKSPTQKTNCKLKNSNFDVESSKNSSHKSQIQRRSGIKNRNQIETKNSTHTIQSHKRQNYIQPIYRPSSAVYSINWQHNNNVISKNNFLPNYKINAPSQPHLQYILHNPPNKNVQVLPTNREKQIQPISTINLKPEFNLTNIYYDNRNLLQKQNAKYKISENNTINVNHHLNPLKYQKANVINGYHLYKDQQQNQRIIKGSTKISRKSEKGEQLPVIIEESQGQIKQWACSKNPSEQRLFKPVNTENSLITRFPQQTYHRISNKTHQVKSINELIHKRTSSIKDSSDDAQSQYSQAIFNSSRSKIKSQSPVKSGLFSFKKSQSKKDSSFNQSYIFNGSNQYKINHQRPQNQ